MKLTKIFPLVIPVVLSACSDPDPTRIVLGTGNETFEPNELQYQKPFSVQVTTVDGNPDANASVTVSVKNIEYYKGTYVAGADRWNQVVSASCAAEDINNNGVLETGEDINNNGRLDPTNPATVSEHPTETPTINAFTGEITTDEFGFGFFSLTYPQSESNWVRIQITVTADNDGGTENTEVFELTLPAILADLSDTNISPPGGTEGKYGIAADCTDPN